MYCEDRSYMSRDLRRRNITGENPHRIISKYTMVTALTKQVEHTPRAFTTSDPHSPHGIASRTYKLVDYRV